LDLNGYPKIDMCNEKYLAYIWLKKGKQLLKEKTTEEIENIMKSILPLFYYSVKLKSMPENNDRTHGGIKT
jgi:hypothetical protein